MKFFKRFKKNKKENFHGAHKDQNEENNQINKLSQNLNENFHNVKEMLGNSDDIITRVIRIGKEGRQKAGIIYTDGLIDSVTNQSIVMESLMVNLRETEVVSTELFHDQLLLQLKERVLTAGNIKDVMDNHSLIDSLLSGMVILLLDGYTKGLAIGMKGGQERSITESMTETTVRGPHEGFVENIRSNTAMIRRKIKDPNLWIETRKIGRVTNTNVSIMYIKGIANDKVIEEVRRRLDRIDTDSVLESGYIEEFIQDKTWTPFPTTYYTERPDVVAANLVEGRVAILVDGSPSILLVPVLFIQFLHSPDDYYTRADFATLTRFLRYIGFNIALLAPSLYIAITTFHQEMLPTSLLSSLAAQREGVPFPAFIEALMMEITFEILREASLRMPKAIGSAISVVGTLVIGTAAVEAGIVSAVMVIVVAITAISSFIVSSYELSISVRILRFPFMALAASFGMFGVFWGYTVLVLHWCTLRSFGVPYMSPFAPYIQEDQKDALFRFPRWSFRNRPRLISQKNRKREDTPPPNPREQ
jgi:spore germination protein KA